MPSSLLSAGASQHQGLPWFYFLKCSGVLKVPEVGVCWFAAFVHLGSPNWFVKALSIYKCVYIRTYMCVCIDKRKSAPILLLQVGICTFSLDYFMPNVSCDLYFESKF